LDGLAALAQALEGSAFGTWARGSSYAYPAANLVHLLGLVLLVGGIGVLDLRLAGAWRRLPVAPLSKALTPVAVGGLFLMIASGSVMFAADAGPLLKSTAFQRKVAFIALAVINAVAFRALWLRHLPSWDATAPAAARLMAAGSVALWLIVAALGRLIAYT